MYYKMYMLLMTTMIAAIQGRSRIIEKVITLMKKVILVVELIRKSSNSVVIVPCAEDYLC